MLLRFSVSIVPKKVSPTVTLKNLIFYKRGVSIPSYKFAINNIACIGGNLFFTMMLLDETLRADIIASGVYANFEAILDCRDKI